jgi:hypothetical protein
VPGHPGGSEAEGDGRHRRAADLFIPRGVPGHVRSDNGPESVAEAVQAWITGVGAKVAYIAPGSPRGNGFVESLDARLRDEPLDGGVFHGLREAQVVIEGWRRHYDTPSPARLARLPRAGAGGVRACLRQMAGRATSASLTDRPGRGPEAGHALTFTPDHLMGAGQR